MKILVMIKIFAVGIKKSVDTFRQAICRVAAYKPA